MNVCNEIPAETRAREVARDVERLLRAAFGRGYCEERFDVRYDAATDALELIYVPEGFFDDVCRRYVEAAMLVVLYKHSMAGCATAGTGPAPYDPELVEIRATVGGWKKLVEFLEEVPI